MLPAILQLLHAPGAPPPRERRPRNLPAREGLPRELAGRLGVDVELAATEMGSVRIAAGSGATAARPPLWQTAVERRRRAAAELRAPLGMASVALLAKLLALLLLFEIGAEDGHQHRDGRRLWS